MIQFSFLILISLLLAPFNSWAQPLHDKRIKDLLSSGHYIKITYIGEGETQISPYSRQSLISESKELGTSCSITVANMMSHHNFLLESGAEFIFDLPSYKNSIKFLTKTFDDGQHKISATFFYEDTQRGIGYSRFESTLQDLIDGCPDFLFEAISNDLPAVKMILVD